MRRLRCVVSRDSLQLDHSYLRTGFLQDAALVIIEPRPLDPCWQREAVAYARSDLTLQTIFAMVVAEQ